MVTSRASLPQRGWLACLAVPRTCVTRTAWTGSVTASTSREKLLPWVIGTTIPTSFVIRSAWARSTATAPRREHLLGKRRTGDQGSRCQNARKKCGNATHKIDEKDRSFIATHKEITNWNPFLTENPPQKGSSTGGSWVGFMGVMEGTRRGFIAISANLWEIWNFGPKCPRLRSKGQKCSVLFVLR